jgi:hypothetical protein
MNETALAEIRSARFAYSIGGFALLLIAFFITRLIPNFYVALVVGVGSIGGGVFCLVTSLKYGKGAAAGLGSAHIALLSALEKRPRSSIPELRGEITPAILAGPILRNGEKWLDGLIAQGLVTKHVRRREGLEDVAYELTYSGALALEHSRT